MTTTDPHEAKEHWLSRYATNYHKWTLTRSPQGQASFFSRPLGLVELSFDFDGTQFGGRADMNISLSLEIATSLPSRAALRERIALAWTCLRARHVLLMSRVRDGENGRREFVVDVPETNAGVEGVVEKVGEEIVWVDEWYGAGEVDEEEFYKHCLNVGRVVDVSRNCSKLHVLPARRVRRSANEEGGGGGLERFEISLVIVVAHQTSDALAAYTWWSDFMRLLNTPETELKASLETLLTVDGIESRLPPAQEDLYPIPVASSGKGPPSRARLRWYWAVIIVLRSLRRPLPKTFSNPLLRRERLTTPMSLPKRYPQVFDYSPTSAPPMNSGHISARLSHAASARMIQLCRSIGVSIGAGCFALAGLAMMEMQHEKQLAAADGAQQPQQVDDSSTLPFTASFPLNPRPFYGLATPVVPDSCMLAFSEGIVMPYLPSSSSSALPIETRFKAVAKCANAELKTYQKRRPAGHSQGSGTAGTILDPHDPTRLLATGYIGRLERMALLFPASSPQGSVFPTPPSAPALPQSSVNGEEAPPPARATCGVSSIGSTSQWLRRGDYSLEHPLRGVNFAADFRNIKQGVRAREGEFLIGCTTNDQGRVEFGVSYDWSGIGEEMAERWRDVVEGLLEDGRKAGRSVL
ncbi:unnamed protein product [Periconia digitata]|uniref:Uncharacterized protein n=1 Tax=Periconia digitata TaxID=1303443 RepID=A0A9W4XQR8_9PLEO|nr:unnamed protein product [Periconia digitata]